MTTKYVNQNAGWLTFSADDSYANVNQCNLNSTENAVKYTMYSSGLRREVRALSVTKLQRIL